MTDQAHKDMLGELRAILFGGLRQRMDREALRLEPRVQEILNALYLFDGAIARVQRDIIRRLIMDARDKEGAHEFTYVQMGLDFLDDADTQEEREESTGFYAPAELILTMPRLRQAVLTQFRKDLMGHVKGMTALAPPDRRQLSDLIHAFIQVRIDHVGQEALPLDEVTLDDVAKDTSDKLGDEATEDRRAAGGEYPKR